MTSSVGCMTFPIYGKIKFMFQTTNQYICLYLYLIYRSIYRYIYIIRYPYPYPYLYLYLYLDTYLSIYLSIVIFIFSLVKYTRGAQICPVTAISLSPLEPSCRTSNPRGWSTSGSTSGACGNNGTWYYMAYMYIYIYIYSKYKFNYSKCIYI